MKHLFVSATIALSVMMAEPATAQQVGLDGYFIALSACEATKKKDADNPGNVRLVIRHAYDIIGRNDTPGTHYQIKVPGAPVSEARWVPMSCGAYAPRAALQLRGGVTPEPEPGVATGRLAPDSIEVVLAASWEPAFCATSAGQGKPECKAQTADRPDATHFSLHGLWPDDLDDRKIFPCYCDRGAPIGCGSSQDRDTSIALSPAVMEQLRIAMPGVQSGLQLHEWPKHGACYEDDKTGPDANADPDEYFTEAMAVLRALNDSAVRALFADHPGQILTRGQIAAAFDEAFGEGAAGRVLIRCARVGGENILSELWINLKGDITVPADLGKLIQAAPPASTSSGEANCASGRVVRVPG